MKFRNTSPEYPIIDPTLYGVDLASDAPTARAESRVFVGSKSDGTPCVVKIYDQLGRTDLTVETLRTYQHLTGRVDVQLSRQAETLQLDRGAIPLRWRVIPIEDVGVLSGDKCAGVTVSEYAGGDNLFDVLHSEAPTAGVGFYQLLIGQIEPIHDFLAAVDKRLNRSLGAQEILISPWNIRSFQENDALLWTVTDVCGWVSALVKRRHPWFG